MLIKLIFSIIGKYKYVRDQILNTMLLHVNEIDYMIKPKIIGQIIIKNKGKITIGNNVLIINHSNNNPVGIPHSTILCTRNKNAKITIGDNVGISGASIVAATSITIGNRVLIGGGVGVWDTDFHPLDPKMRTKQPARGVRSARIIIEDDVFIGARAIILKGTTIGKGSIIGAGCVVSKNIPSNCIAYGNPVRIREINENKKTQDKA